MAGVLNVKLLLLGEVNAPTLVAAVSALSIAVSPFSPSMVDVLALHFPRHLFVALTTALSIVCLATGINSALWPHNALALAVAVWPRCLDL